MANAVKELYDFMKARGAVIKSAGNDDKKDETPKDDGDDAIPQSKYNKALAFIKSRKSFEETELRKHLSVGYNLTARIVEKMEEDGLVGSAKGSKRIREVLSKDAAEDEDEDGTTEKDGEGGEDPDDMTDDAEPDDDDKKPGKDKDKDKKKSDGAKDKDKKPQGDVDEDDEEDEVTLEIKAHTEVVQKWCALARRNLRTVGRLIPDNKIGERHLVKMLGSIIAPQVRALKKLETSWDPDSRDVKTRAGIVCTRVMIEYMLLGLVEGLKLNQKSVDDEADYVEEQEKNDEDLKDKKGPTPRFGAATDNDDDSERSESASSTRERELERRKTQMKKLLQVVSLQFIKLLRKSLRMIPHDAEVQLKGGIIFGKGKRVPVRPYLTKLLAAYQKLVSGMVGLANNEKAVKNIGNRFVVHAYLAIIWSLFGDPLKLMKRMVK